MTSFEAYYQPEVDLRTGELVAVEALARWNHPVEGQLQADAFIELAEETGAIVAVGRVVLREACAEAARRGGWRTAAGDERPPVLGVNLSARQLAQPDLVDQVQDALDTSGLPPGRLCLEIAEPALMEEPERNLALLHELRRLGVSITVDNVGTGRSSLLYLARFPLAAMKIDRRFVHGLGERRDDSDVVASVIVLGHALGRRVVADGVETSARPARRAAPARVRRRPGRAVRVAGGGLAGLVAAVTRRPLRTGR